MKKLFLFLIVLAASPCALAEIYKHIDAEGRVTYSNVPIKGSVKLNLDPVPRNGEGRSSAPSKAAPTPAGFPKVDQSTQKQRDGKRREILESELATERKALEAAKAAYVEAEKNPEVFQNVVGLDGKPVLGAVEGQAITDASGKPVVGADGKPAKYRKQGGRNMARYAEKMDQLSSEIKNHENNIEMLEKEISRM